MSDRNNLTDEAYNLIKEKIYNFDILPEQTVSDYLLSKELNMSRTPIRQALQILKNDGLLEELPNTSSSYKVSAISVEEIEDIFDFREALELSALSIAWQKKTIDKPLIEKLQILVNTMVDKKNKGETEAHFDADQGFHTELVRSSKNRRLCNAYDGLSFQLQRLRFLTYINHSLQDKASDEHQEIVNALKDNDYNRAVEKLKVHLHTSRRDYIAIFNSESLPNNAFRVLHYLSTKMTGQ